MNRFVCVVAICFYFPVLFFRSTDLITIPLLVYIFYLLLTRSSSQRVKYTHIHKITPLRANTNFCNVNHCFASEIEAVSKRWRNTPSKRKKERESTQMQRLEQQCFSFPFIIWSLSCFVHRFIFLFLCVYFFFSPLCGYFSLTFLFEPAIPLVLPSSIFPLWILCL